VTVITQSIIGCLWEASVHIKDFVRRGRRAARRMIPKKVRPMLTEKCGMIGKIRSDTKWGGSIHK
jgi:hypothetical protein